MISRVPCNFGHLSSLLLRHARANQGELGGVAGRLGSMCGGASDVHAARKRVAALRATAIVTELRLTCDADDGVLCCYGDGKEAWRVSAKRHAVYVQRHYLTPGSWRWLNLPGAERLIGEWFELPDARPI